MIPSDLNGHAFAILVRQHLERSRAEGLPFARAWEFAVEAHPPCISTPHTGVAAHEWEPSTIAFLHSHFAAAYHGRTLGKPFAVEPPATLRGGEHAAALGSFDADGPGLGGPALAPSERRCRWGGRGCDEAAGHGRFGKFCKPHADQLARIAALPTPDFIEATAHHFPQAAA